VKSVGQVKIIDHSPVWQVGFSFLGNYSSLNILRTLLFIFHFGKNISKRKLLIAFILPFFIFRDT